MHGKLLAFLSLMAASASLHADIYKYVDEEGRVTFTNVYRKGAVKLDIDTTPSAPAAGPAANAKPKSAPTVTPASFPRVSPDTQRKRDEARRKILEGELAAETNALESARRALAEGEAVRLGDERHNYQRYLDRVHKLKDSVVLHERNAAAIRSEISRLP